jgi:hypothetical protein
VPALLVPALGVLSVSAGTSLLQAEPARAEKVASRVKAAIDVRFMSVS